MTLEEFLDKGLDVRDQLDYRRLRGEVLTEEEQALLKELDQCLDMLYPHPMMHENKQFLSPELQSLVDEVLRRKRNK